jgi:DNA replication protein DnaC
METLIVMNKVRFILCQIFCGLKSTDQNEISDCILTEDLKNTFTQFLKQKEIPNLLLSGTAGTGKTTVAKSLV